MGKQSSVRGRGSRWMGEPTCSLGRPACKWCCCRLWRLGQSLRPGLGNAFGAGQRVERWLASGTCTPCVFFRCYFD